MMEVYVTVHKDGTGQIKLIHAGTSPTGPNQAYYSGYRTIKLNIDIPSDVFDFPVIDVAWPTPPVVLPEEMVKDLRQWTGHDKPVV